MKRLYVCPQSVIVYLGTLSSILASSRDIPIKPDEEGEDFTRRQSDMWANLYDDSDI